MASSSKTIPNVAWDAKRSAVILFGGNIKGILAVSFDFGPEVSDGLKSRVCFFVLDIFRKRGSAGLKKFYGSDRLREFPKEQPPTDVAPARRYFNKPAAWTTTNLDAMVREWLADHEEYVRLARRDFAIQLEASSLFIEETGIGQIAVFPELDRGKVVCRPAVLVDDFVIALADTVRKSGFRICDADEVNAVAWTANPDKPEQSEGMGQTAQAQATPDETGSKHREARAH